MRDTTKMKTFRSALVVIGAVAFGYLNLQIMFKPFLEKTQAQQALLQSQSSQQQQHSDFHQSQSDQNL
uniref:Putative ovule protein n=1 Tax=Solanum chacoense TaxID=4108 RepID=A0A0V0GFG9_SOLCH